MKAPARPVTESVVPTLKRLILPAILIVVLVNIMPLLRPGDIFPTVDFSASSYGFYRFKGNDETPTAPSPADAGSVSSFPGADALPKPILAPPPPLELDDDRDIPAKPVEKAEEPVQKNLEKPFEKALQKPTEPPVALEQFLGAEKSANKTKPVKTTGDGKALDGFDKYDDKSDDDKSDDDEDDEDEETPLALANTNNTFCNFTSIIAFGDSYTDNGRFHYLEDNRPCPLTMSNGKMWVEWLSEEFTRNYTTNVTSPYLLDFAMSGATTGVIVPSKPRIEPVIHQVSNTFKAHLAQHPKNPKDNHTLYTVWSGINDLMIAYFENIEAATPERIAGEVVKNVETLVEVYGARRIIVMNVPPLDTLPFIYTRHKESLVKFDRVTREFNGNLTSLARNFTERWNKSERLRAAGGGMDELADNLAHRREGDFDDDEEEEEKDVVNNDTHVNDRADELVVCVHDVFSLIRSIVDHPGDPKHGIREVVETCEETDGCDGDGAGFLYWNNAHLTVTAQKLVAADAMKSIQKYLMH
ncbi:hypothetical protein HK101_008039 [Irineochytrium annulatum]|nr:hypothetical protein HK101_008039 [Irineochytrium annulatum]